MVAISLSRSSGLRIRRHATPEELARRQQRRINSAVNLQADAAAEKTLDRWSNGQQPPLSFNVDRPPQGLSPDEYSRLVGELAVQLMSTQRDVGLRYDLEASRQRTAALQQDPRFTDHVSVVFL